MPNTDINNEVLDFQRSYNGSVYTEADQDYWAKTAFWTDHEATCVTLGFEPGPLEIASLDELQSEPGNFDQLTKRAKLVYRARRAGQLSQCLSPKDAIEWLVSINEECAEPLSELVCALPIYGDGPIWNIGPEDMGAALRSIDQLSKKTENECAPVSNATSQTKELSSLRKIALVGAVKGYGYAPTSRRSPVFGEMARDASLIGVELHVDTVRKHVRRAVDEYWCELDD